jgi:hypothetical protein
MTIEVSTVSPSLNWQPEGRPAEEEHKTKIQRDWEQQKKERQREASERKRNLKELKEAMYPERGWETPLEYMLRVMQDPNVPDARRDEMAKAAAPYIHSRRIPENVAPTPPAHLSALTDEELRTMIRIIKKAEAAGQNDPGMSNG